MNHIFILILLFSTKYVYMEVTEFLLSPPKGQHEYTIGEKVVLTCNVKGRSVLSVLFKHKGKYMAENGLCHVNRYKCVTDRVDDRRSYSLEISNMTWHDGGEWFCVEGRQIKKRIIELRVMGEVKKIVATLEPRTANIAEDSYLPWMLYGKGHRTNPYDLTRDVSLRLDCSTGCSSPTSKHYWSHRNVVNTHWQTLTAVNTGGLQSCSLKPEGEGIVNTTNVVIHCSSLAMVGSNEIRCKMIGSEDSKSIFVLCPGGYKPWTLTNGEIIGISIAVGIAALMIVTFFMSAKSIIHSHRYGSLIQRGVKV